MVSVVIPWRSGCPHREAALGWVLNRWSDTGWEVLLGTCGDGPWCKADAVADAVQRASGDVMVVADADVWVDGMTVDLIDAHWAVPHGFVHRLTERATADVLAGDQVDLELVEQPPYSGQPGGGVTVIDRDTVAAIPLDPRFRGWGQEDQAWSLALRTLAGPERRGVAPLVHLWHPPQQRLTRRDGSAESRALYRRYRRASGDRAAMRSLIEEAAAWTSTTS